MTKARTRARLGALLLACTTTGCAATPTFSGDAAPGPGADATSGSSADAATGPGCAGNGGALQPFANHAHPYAPGSILPSHRTQAQLDQVVRARYDAWKSRYVEASCAGDRCFVRSGTNDATVSEAAGYGLVITAYMAGHDAQAHRLFDGLYRYVRAHPSSGSAELMAWSQDHGCGQSAPASSAADGDLDIAYGLLLADRQWGSGGTIHYRDEARRMLGGIRGAEVDASAAYVRLGDWTNPGDAVHLDATRSSDFMPGHFSSFEAAVADGAWKQVRDRSYQMVASLQANHAPSTGLLPDFVIHPTSSPAPAPGHFLEGDLDGTYAFNACRVPWRIATHFLTSGDTRARQAVQKMNTWIRGATGGNPDLIRAGYSLAGNVSSGADFRSMAFVGPFGVGAMVDASNQAWLNAIWDALEQSGSEGYYADTLELLSLIVMSGNWWAPEAAPCP
jgi:endo-1,4-beta-D-glucanase Y